MTAKIAVLGSGAWGSALACVAARSGNDVAMWGRSVATAGEINKQHTNSAYLGDLELDGSIIATTDIDKATDGAELIILSIPTQTLALKLRDFKSHISGATLLTTCKGIDRETGKLPHQLIEDICPNSPVASLSGPSFASDVVAGLPTAVTVASKDEYIASRLSQLLSTEAFRCYVSDDIIGVELGGALKNVLALAVGAARGMELGASAEAALIARGFAEVSRLAVKLGANQTTLNGLSGIGDLVLTCSSPQSRNFSYGMAMGKGESLEGLKLAEGAFTAGVALRLANGVSTDVPITEAIVNVLEKRITAREAVHQLLTRPLKRES